MVKTAGVLTSCKRINSKRITAREAVGESTASAPQQANHCEVSCKRINSKCPTASESLRGTQGRKKAGKEGKYT